MPTTFPERRRFLAALSAAAASLSLPHALRAASAAPIDHREDWTWLLGNWDVAHRRLTQRLAGSDDWETFGGKSALWLAMGGLGTIDDNLLELPAGVYRGLTVRTYDAASDTWAIWWLDGRGARLDAPVRGRFADGVGTFVGADTFEGRPILMRFRWRDLHGARPNWEQAFSADDGKTWEVNWTNVFTRTAATPTPLPLRDSRPHDFDFLVGRWQVAHRRLRRRLASCNDWDEFDGTLVNWPVLGGHGNVGDNVMNFPGGAFRGIGLRKFDEPSGEWLSWWFDSRSPAAPGAPLRGGFAGGVGTFYSEETIDGRTVRTRVRWSAITADSARWEQASSDDDSRQWETNWISEFRRRAG